eukprot:TRINITY_DN2860_c0_g2_i6.p1 TRINITY_DN2860_c0_g2~~TRINITY_DN2860_c0_g2_i6.p1  ORF type:complete len:152 (+),score=14.07 TRINITY_DN2860_c0_g2_i6:556-1011(+)
MSNQDCGARCISFKCVASPIPHNCTQSPFLPICNYKARKCSECMEDSDCAWLYKEKNLICNDGKCQGVAPCETSLNCVSDSHCNSYCDPNMKICMFGEKNCTESDERCKYDGFNLSACVECLTDQDCVVSSFLLTILVITCVLLVFSIEQS